MKKRTLILYIVAVVLIIIVGLIIIWVKFIPANKISFLTDKNNQDSALNQALCVYPVKVTGDSMKPLFQNNETINFNKCFEAENLSEDEIVVFSSKRGPMKLGVIREVVIGDSGTYYKISQETRKEDISDVFPDKIIAVYNQ